MTPGGFGTETCCALFERAIRLADQSAVENFLVLRFDGSAVTRRPFGEALQKVVVEIAKPQFSAHARLHRRPDENYTPLRQPAPLEPFHASHFTKSAQRGGGSGPQGISGTEEVEFFGLPSMMRSV